MSFYEGSCVLVAVLSLFMGTRGAYRYMWHGDDGPAFMLVFVGVFFAWLSGVQLW
jgi:hypothetical protein